MGSLGFGGKFRRGDHGSLYVDCYSEDETPVRKEMIQKANDLLDPLWPMWGDRENEEPTELL
jgi:hypothetical protein